MSPADDEETSSWQIDGYTCNKKLRKAPMSRSTYIHISRLAVTEGRKKDEDFNGEAWDRYKRIRRLESVVGESRKWMRRHVAEGSGREMAGTSKRRW